MANEKLNTDETYLLKGAKRRVRTGLMAASAAVGLYAVGRAFDWYFERNKRSREVTLPEDSVVDWSDISDVLPHISVKASPIAWTAAEIEQRSLGRNATLLGNIERAKRPGAIALLGGNPEIISRARQELNIKHGKEFDAIRYEDEEGKWTTLPVAGGFQLFTPLTGGRIREGQRREVLGAAVIPDEIGVGRVALGFDLPGRFIAVPTHVAEVVDPQDFKEHYAAIPIVSETGKAA